MNRSTDVQQVDWWLLDPHDVLDVLQDELPLSESEARYVTASRSPSTLRGYRHDWLEWCDWSLNRDHAPLPARPEVLAGFISSLADAGAKTGTISRKLSAVRFAHKLVGLDDPTATARVAMTWEGIRRTLAHYTPPSTEPVFDTDQQRDAYNKEQEQRARQARVDQSAPLMPPLLWEVVDACPTETDWSTRANQPSLAGYRDRCLLLVGFFGGLRRSELARIRLEDMTWDERGIVVELPWSKTNQFGVKHDVIALPRQANPDHCPVHAIEVWCALAQITSGPLLRRVTKGNKPGRTSISESGINLLVIEAVDRAKINHRTPRTPPTLQPPTIPVADAGTPEVGGAGISSSLGGAEMGQPSGAGGVLPLAAGRRPLAETARPLTYSAHSLRAGFVTYAHLCGATPTQIAHQTRHASLASLRGYTRLTSVWEDNAVNLFRT